MFKQYSFRQRIWQFILEISAGLILLFILIMGMSFLLVQTGQVTSAPSHFSVDLEDVPVSKIDKTMTDIHYDYVVFDKKSGQLLSGSYQKGDLPNYERANSISHAIEENGVTYTYASNKRVAIVVRHSSLPEFTNAHLRHISYNQFTYATMLIGAFLVTLIAVYRLVREYRVGFKKIQELALNMGKTTINSPRQSKLLEFNDILSHLSQKNNELVYLIEKERLEKKDLSFQVGALSHDVKTPLTVLRGNVELLEMTSLSEEQNDFLDSMKRSISQFENYFSQMMDYTKLLNEDELKEEISLDLFLSDLGLLLKEYARTYQVFYDEKIQVSDLTILINSQALSRAITNIFINACQYAQDGHKQVVFKVYMDQDNLCFSIWNNGQPFSEDARGNASKLFFTEDSGRSGKHYGIGLSFAKGVALKHGGRLELVNPQAGGAEVILKIRVAD